MSRSGYFITMEGSEGAGKTTLRESLKDWFVSLGYNVVLTREPGGTPLAEEIRGVLLGLREEPVAVKAELLLVFAARAQHVEQVILPALEAGSVVICDRFIDSTYAYQAYGRQMPLKLIQGLEELVLEGFAPDCTVLLDLPIEVGLQRAAARGVLDRFETSGLDFFNRVREGFLARANQHPQRYILIDASQPREAVKDQAVAELTQRLPQLKTK